MAVADQEQRRFWITGLPRSRTAWFAEAMRGPDSLCFHELTAKASSFQHLKALWINGPEAYRGNADSACGLHAPRILAEIAPRTLVIDRPLDQVMASLETLFRQPLPHMRPMLDRLRDSVNIVHPLVKRVRFCDLEDRDALMEAADWLVPGSGERAAELMHRNVQVGPERLTELANTPHSMWHMMEAA